MKQILKIFLTAFIFVSALATMANAEHKTHSHPASSAELNMIKSLEGKWVTVSDMFGKRQRLYVEYEVMSDGSAVLEKIFPGTPHEMMSVYYDDHGKLTMTHYCMLKNRPTLKLSSSTDNSVTLRVAKVEGLKSKNQPSMGDISITLNDKNHMTQFCSGKNEGKEQSMTMQYTRVR